MGNPIAVMDLGTNTFHLLIAEITGADHREIVHREVPVKLGEGGINKGFIQPAAFGRGLKAMRQFAELISKHQVKKVKAIATSALRNAANGLDFVSRVKSDTGITIEVINGDKEAEYIYQGIKAGGSLSEKNSLIVDIGGGSCEFIICDRAQIFWKRSLEIGAARLMDKFHQTDHIPAASVTGLNAYLEDNLQSVFKAASGYPVENIVGSSGVFESYASVIELAKGNTIDLKKIKRYEFKREELFKLLDELVLSSHTSRENTKGIIPARVDMIVVASLLLRFIMKKLDIGTVSMSTNSLKEGVLAEMINC